ncbi:MAG: hypothetical protein ABIW33_06555 [Sphingomicrobium sp.]
MKTILLAALIALPATPVFASGAGAFVLVNGTSARLGQLLIRRAGTQEWKALGSAPGAGARSSMAFSDPDCAFDIQATVPGSGSAPVTWAAINLCGAKSVTLQHDSAAGAWVDYDQ